MATACPTVFKSLMKTTSSHLSPRTKSPSTSGPHPKWEPNTLTETKLMELGMCCLINRSWCSWTTVKDTSRTSGTTSKTWTCSLKWIVWTQNSTSIWSVTRQWLDSFSNQATTCLEMMPIRPKFSAFTEYLRRVPAWRRAWKERPPSFLKKTLRQLPWLPRTSSLESRTTRSSRSMILTKLCLSANTWRMFQKSLCTRAKRTSLPRIWMLLSVCK